nr:3-hydroxyacyl-[acyl-carrier-protein] dehydratase FabZ [Enterococcus sp.]
MEKLLTEVEVMELIPNRYPIIYIDYVDSIDPGKKIIATKNVTINEDFFQGHFPGNPVMP